LSSYQPVEEYYSDGFRNLMNSISQWGSETEKVFPSACINTRISPTESVHEWFKRIVNEQLEVSTKPCKVENNMAVFANIRYDNTKIVYANIQVVVVLNDDLDGFYLYGENQNIDCKY